jgi:hypothetical protein
MGAVTNMVVFYSAFLASGIVWIILKLFNRLIIIAVIVAVLFCCCKFYGTRLGDYNADGWVGMTGPLYAHFMYILEPEIWSNHITAFNDVKALPFEF